MPLKVGFTCPFARETAEDARAIAILRRLDVTG
jgi:hypothetical protein